MKLRISLGLFALVALVLGAAPICNTSSGHQCDQYSPCCVEGYCGVGFCDDIACDPSKSYSTSSCCTVPPCVNLSDDFSSGALAYRSNYSGDPSTSNWISQEIVSNVQITGGQMQLELEYQSSTGYGYGATVLHSHSILYGSVLGRVKSGSSSQGIVSAFILINLANGDEIDIEWVGTNHKEFQSNFYSKAISNPPVDYSNGKKHALTVDATAAFHDYEINWQPDRIEWYMDGTLYRTLYKNSTKENGTRFPNTPMQLSIGIWDANAQGQKGTIEWGGGPVQWDSNKTPFSMYVDSVTIKCNDASQFASWSCPAIQVAKSSGSSTTKKGSSGSSGSPTYTGTLSITGWGSGTTSFAAATLVSPLAVALFTFVSTFSTIKRYL